MTRLQHVGESLADDVAPTNGERSHSALSTNDASMVFVHIHKTGGLSIKEAIGRLFDTDNTYDHLDLSAVSASFRSGFVSSHDSFSTLERLPGDKIFVTCLRNPADRLVSLYNYWRSVRHEEAMNLGAAYILEVKRLSFSDFICSEREDLTPYLDNEMTRTFSNPDGWVAEDDFQNACDNLRKMSSILFLENINNDLGSFFDQLGCSARYAPPAVLNKTIENPIKQPEHFESTPLATLSDLSESAMDCLLKRTYFDRRLYAFARSVRESGRRQLIEAARRLPIKRLKLCRGDAIVPNRSNQFSTLLGGGWAADRHPLWSIAPQADLGFTVAGGTGDPAFAELEFGTLLYPNRPAVVLEVRVDSGDWRKVLFINDTQIAVTSPRFRDVTDICAGTGRSWKLKAPLARDANEDRVHVIEFRSFGFSSPSLLSESHDDRPLAVRFDRLSIS